MEKRRNENVFFFQRDSLLKTGGGWKRQTKVQASEEAVSKRNGGNKMIDRAETLMEKAQGKATMALPMKRICDACAAGRGCVCKS